MQEKNHNLENANVIQYNNNNCNDSKSTERKIEIIYITQDIVAINKPHNLNIDGENHEETVESILQKQIPDFLTPKEGNQTKRKIKFIHQLDFATSGVLIMAATRKSCSNVSKCFQERTVRKKYSAVVRGWIDESILKSEDGVYIIESYIDDDFEDVHKFKMKWYDIEDENKRGRHSKTRIFIIKKGFFKGEKATHVHLELVTGRRHQLRIHLSHIGHPIIGDETYGKESLHNGIISENESSKYYYISNREINQRLMLHSFYLEIPLNLDENLKPYTKEHNFPKGNTQIKTEDPFSQCL